MRFTSSSLLLAGSALLATVSIVNAETLAAFSQFHAKPLVVKPGGLVTVTMNFVVTEFSLLRRLEAELPFIQAGVSTNPFHTFDFGMEAMQNKNHTKDHTKGGKHANDDSVTIKSAKIFPNTWSPKESADIDRDEPGDTALFQLPDDGLVENKEYKITYKIRVGRGAESGDVVFIPVAFAGPGLPGFNDIVNVLIK